MINIACSTDRNYFPYLGVMLCSLLENSMNSAQISIYIIEFGVTRIEKKYLKKMVISYGAKLTYIKINHKKFSHLKNFRHITQASYYRTMLADLLVHLDKIIYLDADIILEKDIEELWKVPLKEYYLLAAANQDIHFNSGVMVINAKKWRKEILKKIHPDISNHPKAREACEKMNQIYNEMIM